MSHKKERALVDVLQMAQQLYEEALENGYSTIHEGSVWLCTQDHMAANREIYGRADFSKAMYWIEVCEAEPIPVQGPDDPVLLDFLMQ